MPDVRTYVMIVVEASWAGEDGAQQTVSARMVDKSLGGACIRVKKPIPVGSKICIQWRFEQFSGIVKYCRSEDREYVVGIQRDASPASPKPPVIEQTSTRPAAIKEDTQKATPATLSSPARPSPTLQEAKVKQIPPRKLEIAAAVRAADSREIISRHRWDRDVRIRNRLSMSHRQEISPESHPKEKDANNKRTFMGHKWLDKAPWHHKQDGPNTSGHENSNGDSAKENSMPPFTSSSEKAAAHSAREVPSLQAELLPMEDIYIAAGITAPRKGYSVKKVAEMLNSEHIRSLSKELKRSSVLMALDAAGVSHDQIQRDAKARQDALNAYEAEQKKQAEADWSRRAEEVAYIQSELESIKAHYMGRINRTMEGIARDKARFSNWQSMKQEETQSMTEALDLCLKSPVTEATTASLPEASTASGMAATAAATPKP
jgi:hypothetical protein